jgi:hypothetical protein
MTPRHIEHAILEYAREHELPVTVDQLQTACSVLRRAKIKAATIRSRIRSLAKHGELEADDRDRITTVHTPPELAEPMPEWMRAAERTGKKVRAARKLIAAHDTIYQLRVNLERARRERLPSLVELLEAALADVLGELYPDGLPPDMAAYAASAPEDDSERS